MSLLLRHTLEKRVKSMEVEIMNVLEGISPRMAPLRHGPDNTTLPQRVNIAT
jgi:hypothetical protein